ncbi:unnamed protein product [Staurois parvus]|uniref:Uncharacterized protein n=1 Tax=Staurois parvus TaxID=386267 RepID=A0ABN9B7F7_9NEOB|nr:unnamed protein product [Staurois parvus]
MYRQKPRQQRLQNRHPLAVLSQRRTYPSTTNGRTCTGVDYTCRHCLNYYPYCHYVFILQEAEKQKYRYRERHGSQYNL